MATQKLNISELMLEAKQIAKSRPYSSLSLLFIFPLSFSIVAYPTLQHSLATPHSESHLQFPFNGDPIVFKPVGLFFIYLFTLLCLSVCATGTITYSLYQGYFGQPVNSISAIKSLSKSLMRLFATFFCAQAIILPGLLVVGLIIFGVTRAVECLGLQIQYDSDCYRVLYVLSWVVLSLGWLLYMYVDWVVAPVIVVVESSWGLEPLKRSAYLVKGNKGAVVRLLMSICFMIWLTVYGFGSWGQIFPFGSSVYESALVVLMIAFGSYIMSTHLLRSLAIITILYMKCTATDGVLPENIKESINQENQEYASLPSDEEKLPHVV